MRGYVVFAAVNKMAIGDQPCPHDIQGAFSSLDGVIECVTRRDKKGRREWRWWAVWSVEKRAFISCYSDRDYPKLKDIN